MLTAEEMEPAGHVHVNAGRLWDGGIATAIVAALTVLAGVLITRGVLGIPVLAPRAGAARGYRPGADRPLPLSAPRHETGRPAGALYPAFIPGWAPAVPPVPARAGRGPRP